ncbi:MAG: response regulator [Pseudomonadota bacterium]
MVGPRVLIVDDEEVNRDLLEQELALMGCESLAAEDGLEALELLRDETVDVVLLDLLMPRLDGFGTLRAMRDDPDLSEIPVLVISALQDVGNVVAAIELGAEDHLPKPFEPAILKARVNTSIEKRRLRQRDRENVARIEAERRRVESLLASILPDDAARELKETGQVAPRRHEDVAVMFADVTDFTRYSEQEDPAVVIDAIGRFVDAADEGAERYGLERIKVVGDAVLVTANLLKPCDRPVDTCYRLAADLDAALRVQASGWRIRAGIGFGNVMSGVLGRDRFAFDIWGRAVNTAARLAALPGDGIAFLSPAARDDASSALDLSECGTIDLKGIGPTRLYCASFSASQ